MQQKGDEEDKDRCFFNFKQWHVVAFIAFAILAGVFIISIILFLQFPKLIESNIRHVSCAFTIYDFTFLNQYF